MRWGLCPVDLERRGAQAVCRGAGKTSMTCVRNGRRQWQGPFGNTSKSVGFSMSPQPCPQGGSAATCEGPVGKGRALASSVSDGWQADSSEVHDAACAVLLSECQSGASTYSFRLAKQICGVNRRADMFDSRSSLWEEAERHI